MLTTVTGVSQLQLTESALTSVDMSRLKDRLSEAMGETVSRADLIQAVRAYGGRISRAAVSKWFGEKEVELKAAHAFAVARRCNVNPEWLATGKGAKQRQVSANPDRLAPKRLALIQAYGQLHPDVRRPVRMLIETLALATDGNYLEFQKNLAERTERAKKEPA